VNIYLYLFNDLIILKFYVSTRVVKNYLTPIWSRVLALLELLGTALQLQHIQLIMDKTTAAGSVTSSNCC